MFSWLKNLFVKKSTTPKEIYTTTEVFKVSGVPPHTFVERKVINEKIEDFFSSKDNVLLFLGYSKSGKTVYRKKYLEKNDFELVVFRCNSDKTIVDLYNTMAAEFNLGQVINSSNLTSSTQSHEIGVGIEIPHTISTDHTYSEEVTYSYAITEEQTKVKIDINFLCKKLKGKKVMIVLEDYHLASNSMNKTLSEDIKPVSYTHLTLPTKA